MIEVFAGNLETFDFYNSHNIYLKTVHGSDSQKPDVFIDCILCELITLCLGAKKAQNLTNEG